MKYAPVVVFAYRRLDKLKKAVRSLEDAKLSGQTRVFVFSDGYKGENDQQDVQAVRKYLRDLKRENKFCDLEVYESDFNRGLAASIIYGVSKIVKQYQKVIVVEDDLVVSPDFLEYMNGALDYYREYKEYGSISAYTYPMPILDSYQKDVYVTGKGECWGWGTWQDRWESVDWEVKDFPEYLRDRQARKRFESLQYGIDAMLRAQMKGELDSWAVRWCYHLFKNGLLTVYPRKSKTINIGFDGSGTHCSKSNIYADKLDNDRLGYTFERLGVNKDLERCAAVFEKRSMWQKIKDRIGGRF